MGGTQDNGIQIIPMLWKDICLTQEHGGLMNSVQTNNVLPFLHARTLSSRENTRMISPTLGRFIPLVPNPYPEAGGGGRERNPG